MAKPGTTEGFPFDESTLVFKVMGKMFLLTPLDEPELKFNVKCDPERSVELRAKHPCVQPGYHMNKLLWNTVVVDGSVSDEQLMQWIDHSYEQVVNGLDKKTKSALQGLTDEQKKRL